MLTIFLMLAVMRDLVDFNDFQKNCQGYIHQAANTDIGEPERVRFKFNIRDDVAWFLERYVQTYGGKNEVETFKSLVNNNKQDVSIRNMSNAILTLRTTLGIYSKEEIRIELPIHFPYNRAGDFSGSSASSLSCSGCITVP